MTEQLHLHIQQLLPGFTIPQEQMAHFFQTISIKKDALLLNEKEICDSIYFVNKGCLYLFYNHNNQKQVVHFALENWWLTDYKTFCDSKPAVYAIAAMEDSEITCLSRTNYETLLLQFPFMALYFNKIHERAYGAALFKQKTFATLSKKDFYRHFRNTYPALIQRIPDPIFASYMGVSPETLQTLKDTYIS
ncbi:Crp/Fnr family transcriptional regulator [Mucilaginibacter sp.]|jgi:CRP-like cAMP-binding protein|uniref:Crp/Fnr family transcriptional regulator n=1 Tax=Mucilaginibacter sp. TaxID=1882438 RepID=UPI00356A59E6